MPELIWTDWKSMKKCPDRQSYGFELSISRIRFCSVISSSVSSVTWCQRASLPTKEHFRCYSRSIRVESRSDHWLSWHTVHSGKCRDGIFSWATSAFTIHYLVSLNYWVLFSLSYRRWHLSTERCEILYSRVSEHYEALLKVWKMCRRYFGRNIM
jgi:hypothetical protein